MNYQCINSTIIEEVTKGLSIRKWHDDQRIIRA